MTISESGFEYFEINNYGSFLKIDSAKLKSTINHINNEQIKNICISPRFGYDLSDLNFLSECPNIEMVFIVDKNYKIEALNNLRYIKFLSTSSNIDKIDFSNFKNLEYCCITWSKTASKIENCQSINHLRINKYDSSQKDLTIFPFLKKIACFGISRGANFESYRNRKIRKCITKVGMLLPF